MTLLCLTRLWEPEGVATQRCVDLLAAASVALLSFQLSFQYICVDTRVFSAARKGFSPVDLAREHSAFEQPLSCTL